MTIRRGRLPAVLLFSAFFLLGMSLRGALGGVSVLLPLIGRDLGLSVPQQGALTSAALVSMALAAPWGARLGNWLGPDRSLGWVLVVLCLAELARFVTAGFLGLMATVVAVGLAMGVGSTLVPTALRRRIPRRHLGLMTGAHGAGMSIGVAVAALLALPVAGATEDWRPGLGLWSVATLITGLAWWLMLRKTEVLTLNCPRQEHPSLTLGSRIVRSRPAWLVTYYAAVPMVVGFTVLAWLPAFFVNAGLTLVRATTNLVLFQIIQLAAMIVLPVLLDRSSTPRMRRTVLVFPPGAATIGILLLMVDPLAADVLAALLLGLGAGGGTVLGMTLIARFAASDEQAAGLGSMVFAVSFSVSALSPVLIGVSVDLWGNFTIGFGVLGSLTLSTIVAVVLFSRILDAETL